MTRFPRAPTSTWSAGSRSKVRSSPGPSGSPATSTTTAAPISPRSSTIRGIASIDVWLSTGSTFVRQRWATQQGAFWGAQKWLAGDFDGDGRADLANVFNDLDQISIDVHRSTRNGFTRSAGPPGRATSGTRSSGSPATSTATGTPTWPTCSRTSARRRSTSIARQAPPSPSSAGPRERPPSPPRRSGSPAPSGTIASRALDRIQRQGRHLARRVLSKRDDADRRAAAAQLGPFSVAQKWLAGNFGGGERRNLAKVFDDRGQASIDVVNDPDGRQRWATQQGGYWDAQQWLAGDFDGDQMDDLANVFGDNGFISIDVHHPRP